MLNIGFVVCLWWLLC